MLHWHTIICGPRTRYMNEVPHLGNLSVATGCLWNKKLRVLTKIKLQKLTLSSGYTTQVLYTVYIF